MNFYSFLESKFPISNSEDWDNPGIITGSKDFEPTKILITVDITKEVVREAIKEKADFILSHHPLLFRPIFNINSASSKGQIIESLIQSNITLYCGHTNFDIGQNGTADNFVNLLGIKNYDSITINGLGRFCELEQEITLESLATKIKSILPSTVSPIKVVGDKNKVVKTIAALPGSGDSIFEDVKNCKPDVYITSDLRHHPALDFKEDNSDIALIDVPHSTIESVFADSLIKDINNEFPKIEVIKSSLKTEAFDFVI